MDLNPIGAFVTVVQAGSFTAAARQLSMPTTTVSAQVARLERTLGVRLLQRSTRKLRLTDAGEAYFGAVQPGIELIQGGETQISTLLNEPQGVLRITTTTDLLPPDVIATVLSTFTERHPKVNIEIDMSQRMVDFLHEPVDVAIRAGKLPDSSLVSRKIGMSCWVLVASPGYLQQAEKIGNPLDLQQHMLLQFGGSDASHWQLMRARKTVAIRVSKRTVVNHLEVIKSLTVAGKGVSILPTYYIRDELSDRRLIRVLPEWMGGATPLYVVYPGRKHVAPKVSSFVDFAVEVLGSYFNEEVPHMNRDGSS